MPLRQQELASLTRDYETLKQQYDANFAQTGAGPAGPGHRSREGVSNSRSKIEPARRSSRRSRTCPRSCCSACSADWGLGSASRRCSSSSTTPFGARTSSRDAIPTSRSSGRSRIWTRTRRRRWRDGGATRGRRARSEDPRHDAVRNFSGDGPPPRQKPASPSTTSASRSSPGVPLGAIIPRSSPMIRTSFS